MARLRGSSIVAALILAVGCIHEPTAENEAPASKIVPLCQLGCVETDPFPSAPGIFLGSAVTPDLCADGSAQQDTDQDGLSDFCEKNLAAAFAPQLAYSSLDDVRGEPRWVARMDGDSVIIGYLFAYYTDFGAVSTTQCKMRWLLPIFVLIVDCEGHNGDPEQVMLVTSYDYAKEHWVLRRARYYQHEGFTDYPTSPVKHYPIGVEYPDRNGGYPRVYVSMRKHSSYARISECATGGTLGSDTCDQTDTYQRVSAGANLNIGSRTVHTAAQDSSLSTNPSYAYFGGGRYEAFWTPKTFRGWVPDSIGGGGGNHYSGKLQSMGF